MSIAFLFPGQGAQRPGFLHRLPSCPAVERTLQEVSAILRCDPLSLDSPTALQSTESVQLAVLIAGVAMLRALADRGVYPSLAAGHSLGAFTAAVCTGALNFADALRLVSARAQRMQSEYPSGYGMAAIVGLTEARVARILREIRAAAADGQAELYVAAVNAPRQITITGTHPALKSAVRAAHLEGAQRAAMLAVAVPSHCELLRPVADLLRSELRSLRLEDPRISYLCNHSARATCLADDIREDLIRGVVSPVRWHESTVVMTELGARLFIELPPGAALSRLAQAAFPDLRAIPLFDVDIAAVAALVERDYSANI